VGVAVSNGYISGKPDTEWWMQQVRKGIAYRKKHSRESDWARWRQYYRGYWPRGTLPVNLFFRMLRTVVPKIYFRNPSISVQPSKPGLEQQVFARLIERIDNKLMRTMRIKNQIKQMVHDTWMFGTGVGKRGFGQEFHPAPDMITGGSDPFARDGGVRSKTEYHATIKDNMPWFLENPTGGFIVPSGSRNFQECRWYAGWYRRPIDDLKEDSRFKNTAMLKGSHQSDYNAGQIMDASEGPVNEIDLVEIRDTKTGKAFVIAPYGEHDKKVLYFGDDTMQVNGRTPFYTSVFNPDDEVCWGVPDSVVLEPQQLEINEIRTLTMKHRRLAIVKLLYKEKALDISEIEKILNGDVLAAVRVNAGAEMTDVEFRQTADIPRDLFVASEEVMNDVRENSGFSRNQFGNYAQGSADRTATESNIINAAAEIRVDERRDNIADLIVDLFEDIHVDIFDRWQNDIVEQVMGPNDIPVWVTFKPAMLKAAQYELQVDPDSSVPETREVRAGKAVQTYSLLKDNPLIDPQLLTQYLLHSLHGVQFDNMMRTLQQLAASGAPGSTSQNPLNPGQYMQLLAQGGSGQQGA
jgi:hypothetical protein